MAPMTTTTKPEALITTPTDECLACARYEEFGTARRFAENEFAHCGLCGSSDLVDTRSPFEVLAEARRNVAAVEGDDEAAILRRWDREDVVRRVEAVVAASGLTADHCSDCRRFGAPARRDLSMGDIIEAANTTEVVPVEGWTA